MCQFLSGLLFGILLLCMVYAVPLHDARDESAADNIEDGAAVDVLVRRLETVLTNQLASVREEREQTLKRKILKQIEELDADDAEHLNELLSQRRLTQTDKRYSWYCPWCDIGERLVRLIKVLCLKKQLCFDEFQDIVKETSSERGR